MYCRWIKNPFIELLILLKYFSLQHMMKGGSFCPFFFFCMLAIDGAEHPVWELLFVYYKKKVIVQEKMYCVEWFTEAKPTTWVH